MKANSEFFRKINIKISQIDILRDIAQKYYSLIQFIIIGVTALLLLKIDLIGSIFISAGVILFIVGIVLYDWFFIYPKKAERLTKNNPFMVEIQKDLNEILTILKDRETH